MLKFPPFHERVLEPMLALCQQYNLYLAGGYAVKAHGLVDRPSQDLDFATNSFRPLPEIIDRVTQAYRDAGFEVVDLQDTNAQLGRIEVHDTATGEKCEVDFLKEPLQRAPVSMGRITVVAMDDLAGMKASALATRAAPRDFIDVRAISEFIPLREIERRARIRNDEEFHVRKLAESLEAISELAPDEFEALGLDDDQLRELMRWAQAWADEIKQRRAADGDADEDYEPDIEEALYED